MSDVQNSHPVVEDAIENFERMTREGHAAPVAGRPPAHSAGGGFERFGNSISELSAAVGGDLA